MGSEDNNNKTNRDSIRIPKLANRTGFVDCNEPLIQYFKSKILTYLMKFELKPPILLNEANDAVTKLPTNYEIMGQNCFSTIFLENGWN